MILNLDFETRSAIDLTKVGAHIYAGHQSTRVLCASYSFDAGHTVKRWPVWIRDARMPEDLYDALLTYEVEIQAWNANFERLILRDVLKIDIIPERFHCTMIRARSMALPGSLELCARALEMPWKKGDDSLMRKWCAPLEDGSWADDLLEYDRLCDYCDDDVRTEAGLGRVLRELSADERADYAVNERINDRGIMVDISLARAAQHYAKDELADICEQLNTITQGVVTSPKQYARIKDWLKVRLPSEVMFILDPDEETGKVSFDAAARDEILGRDYEDVFTGPVRDLVELVHDGGKASVSKFATMQARAGADQRVRGAYNLNGAGQTGRYSSSGLQVHNYIRASLPNIEDVVEAILLRVPRQDLIRAASFDADGGLAFTDTKRRERIRRPFNVLTTLSRTLRPSLIAPPGKILVWRDWSAIEARVLPWLSQVPMLTLQNSASDVLNVFRSGKDIYRRQAMMSFGVGTEAEVTDLQRQGGKVQILSFGYGGGAGAGMRMARTYGLDIDKTTADEWKKSWRQTNPWAEPFWAKLEVAAFKAVQHPETVFKAGRVEYFCSKDMLWCMLPSGRMIAYPFPETITEPGRWGDTDTVVCMKASYHPKKGTNYWPTMRLWGGFQAENITQAEAATLLRWSLREIDANGWPVIGHTHDEIVLEVDEDEEDEAQAVLKDIMDNPPREIFGDLPLASEGRSGFAYGK